MMRLVHHMRKYTSPRENIQYCDNQCVTTESCTTMSRFRFLMSQEEIAEKAGISQQVVGSITAKVEITSLNSHFCPSEPSTKCGG